ncbi:MAG: O-antigen ligase family protein [bacterium]|nr:O-antigen ligase family protein [bacterium]
MDPAQPKTWSRRLLVAAAVAMLFTCSLSIAVSQSLLGVALVALAAGGRRAWPRTDLEIPTVCLFAWAALMVPLSTDPGQSLFYLRRFYLFAALWVVAAAAVGETNRRLLFWALLAGGTVLSGWGLVTALVEHGGLFNRRMAGISGAMTSGALLLMVGLVAAGATVTRGLGRRSRLVAGAVAVLVLVGLVQTLTRSAWLGYLAGLGTLGMALRPRHAVLALVAVTAVAVLLLALPHGWLPDRLAKRLDPVEIAADKSTQRRLETWRGGLVMIEAHPVTGVGDRGLTAIGPDYYGDENTLYHGHMHSNLVHLAVIWGVPGLALGLFLMVAQVVVPWRRWRRMRTPSRRGPPWARAWTLGALAVGVGFFVAGLTEWYFGDAESYQMYLAILGAGLGGGAAATEA